MKLHTKLTLTTFVLLGSGLTGAQSGRREAPPTFPDGAGLTVEQMLEASEGMGRYARETDQHIQHLQAVARKEKDIIKMSCVNDKYVEFKAEGNILDDARAELQSAGDTERRFGAYSIAKDGVYRVQKIREAANACIGEYELGSLEESTFTGPVIIDDPTGALPFDDRTSVGIEPPGYASPFD